MAEVFVVDRSALFEGAWPQGFLPVSTPAAATRLLEQAFRRGRFVDRDLAERTPAWKQWIPYCLLRCLDAAPTNGSNPRVEGIFRVRRSKGQTEARLHGRWSIGLGGHVDPEDGPAAGGTDSGSEFFARALLRELHEELHLTLPPGTAPQFLGVLNDDSTAVGQVHAGLVYRLDLPMPLALAEQTVRVREISKMSGGFGSLVEFRDLWLDRLRFETWSQRLVDAGIVGPMGGSTEAEG